MMARREFSGWVMLGAVVLGLGGCKAGESPSYRYKLAVEVETPEGVRTVVVRSQSTLRL